MPTQIENLEIEEQCESGEEANIANKKDNTDKSERKNRKDGRNDIAIVTKGLLLAILYVALNLDHSEILLSHLDRFIREGRLNIFDCIKYVPKELNKKSIPNWKSFLNSRLDYFAPIYVRTLAMTCFKKLDLGTPLFPDMRKIIDNYVTELCLPKEFKNLVFSLMNRVPCDFLQINSRSNKKSTVRTPDFEGIGMSYVLIALKMCFGLDDDYEIRQSDAVDKINEEENLSKSFKLGFAEPSERLFSFREWCNYLQYRKIILCNHYLPMSRQHNLEVDDHVFMEHLGERRKGKVDLRDQLTMDLLNKLPLEENVGVIPKSEFFATLTPLTTYTDVIVKYIQDPELSLLLSEDFSQYSLKYACEDLALPKNIEDLVQGVSENNKTLNPIITGTLESKKADFSMVYIRNCENKNWLKTKPPTIEHITKINEPEGSDKESDHGYNSNVEYIATESDLAIDNIEDLEINRKLQFIEEEEEGKNIFDDDFNGLDVDVKNDIIDPEYASPNERSLLDRLEFENAEDNLHDSKFENHENDGHDMASLTELRFNPETFNREETIKELIIAACKKYKIPKPVEYNSREPRKRKNNIIDNEKTTKDGTKRKRGETKQQIAKLLDAYYKNLENDVLNKVSEHVKTVVSNKDNDFDLDGTTEKMDTTPQVLDEITNHNDGDLESRLNIEENNNNVHSSIANGTLEPSVLENESDDEEITNLVSKTDPNFDEKTHHIQQLYVKFKKKVDTEDMFELDDPCILKILDEKIEECAKGDVIEIRAADLRPLTTYASDSEDDVPLIIFKQEKKLMHDKKKQRREKLERLIKNSKHIKEYKYWFRHYSAPRMQKSLDIHETFDTELKENCPRSFNFVLKVCASILNCTAYSLYKSMQNIEQMLIETIK